MYEELLNKNVMIKPVGTNWVVQGTLVNINEDSIKVLQKHGKIFIVNKQFVGFIEER